MRKKISVGVLGCTGTVGQKLISLLSNHPWFEITDIAASKNSANKIYKTHVNWKEHNEIPKKISTMKIKNCTQKMNAQILFSSLNSSVAGKIEAFYAKNGHIVLSNSKNFRMKKNIPLVIPEINSEHFRIIKKLNSRLLGKNILKKKGFIVTNPNCSVIILAISLFPIFKTFGLDKIFVSTMQAISGAGYPGIPSMDILGNTIPDIKNEEKKIQTEILKIFGTYKNGEISSAKLKISASCNRVPVHNGHTLDISFSTTKKASKKDLINAIQKLKSLDLPSSPKMAIKYFSEKHRPQPLLDVNEGDGMTVSVGNLRPCNVLDWKFSALGHNTIRGAAGAAILNAEYLVANNLL